MSKKDLLEGLVEAIVITTAFTLIVFYPVLTVDQIKALIVLGFSCWTSYKLGQYVTKREFIKKRALRGCNQHKAVRK